MGCTLVPGRSRASIGCTGLSANAEPAAPKVMTPAPMAAASRAIVRVRALPLVLPLVLRLRFISMSPW
jgi:hypothetical protein